LYFCQESPLNHSIIKRAKEKRLVEIYIHNLRDYTTNKYRQVDDTPFGGGAGMVLQIEPIDKCISKLKSERTYDEIIYMTPDAAVLNQNTANQLSLQQNIIILTGHYKGVDQRVRDLFITKEISIGDYVLSGGELASAVLPPVYTRPAEYKGVKVPEILLSGNFPKIEEWRQEEAEKRTKKIRPDLNF